MLHKYPFPSDNAAQYLLKLAHINVRQGEVPEHRHKYAELHIALEGSALNIINGAAHRVIPGDVFVCLPETIHEQREINNYKFCILKFDYEALLAEIGELRNMPAFQLLFILEPRIRNDANAEPTMTLAPEFLPYVRNSVEILEEEIREQKPTYEAVSKHMFLSLIALICRNSKRRAKSSVSKKNWCIASALSYMESNYESDINIDMLADTVHYSKRHFSRLFKESCGVSPMVYLDSIRLNKAYNLLMTTSLTVSQIAKQCGFDDSNLLCRHFKQGYGITPNECRKLKG